MIFQDFLGFYRLFKSPRQQKLCSIKVLTSFDKDADADADMSKDVDVVMMGNNSHWTMLTSKMIISKMMIFDRELLVCVRRGNGIKAQKRRISALLSITKIGNGSTFFAEREDKRWKGKKLPIVVGSINLCSRLDRFHSYSFRISLCLTISV